MGIVSRVAVKAATEAAEKSAAKSAKTATRKIDLDAAETSETGNKAILKDDRQDLSSSNNVKIGASSNKIEKSSTAITEKNEQNYNKQSAPKFITAFGGGVVLVVVTAAIILLKAYLKRKPKAL